MGGGRLEIAIRGSTVIMILEDDAHNGPDHVDSHRPPVRDLPGPNATPWIARCSNTASMLRTMEFLLGLKPMTHLDAGARPMATAFQSQPNPAPMPPKSRAFH